MPTRRRRCQPRTRKAFLNYPQLRFVRPSTAATSVNNLKATDITTVSMAIHTDNQRYVGLFDKAAHTEWIHSIGMWLGSSVLESRGYNEDIYLKNETISGVKLIMMMSSHTIFYKDQGVYVVPTTDVLRIVSSPTQ